MGEGTHKLLGVAPAVFKFRLLATLKIAEFSQLIA